MTDEDLKKVTDAVKSIYDLQEQTDWYRYVYLSNGDCIYIEREER